MRKIEALIRPFELDEVRDNLHKIGIQSITVTDVRTSSGTSEDADSESYLGENYAGYVIEFMPKVKIEIFVEAAKVQSAADAVLKSSRANKSSETIFVYEVKPLTSS